MYNHILNYQESLEVLLLFLVLVERMTDSLDGKIVAVDVDRNIVLAESGKVGFHYEVVAVLTDIGAEKLRCGRAEERAECAEQALVEIVLGREGVIRVVVILVVVHG